MRAFTYVIVHDGGAAPNYDPPMTTLAICKPRIRKAARIGDLVLAFSAARLSPEPHGVRWAGIVSEKLTFPQYWADPRFASKKPTRSKLSDNIYRPHEGGLLWVENHVHGPEAANQDLSGEYVLCLSPSWQFGDAAPVLPEEFGLRMLGGRRGHRVSDLSAKTWERLREWLNGEGAQPLQLPARRSMRSNRSGAGCGGAATAPRRC